MLDVGSSVELAAGGLVTPLAQDTLRARRVTVVAVGALDPGLPSDLAPVADIRRVAIGSDHSGVALKKALVQHLRGRGLAVTDVGTDGPDPVDYPDIAAAVGLSVVRKESDAGIVIDGAGIGSAIAANKIKGIRAAMCMRFVVRGPVSSIFWVPSGLAQVWITPRVPYFFIIAGSLK